MDAGTEQAEDRQFQANPLAAILAAIIGYTDAKLDPKWFGQKLATDVGKITDKLRLCYDKDSHSKINVWWVQRLE
jgi:hypothetical protein